MAVFSTKGKYLKWQDLNGADTVLTIESYQLETLKSQDGQEQEKWVLYFRETDQGFALNKTNGTIISTVLGSQEMDNWIGQRITLYTKEDVEMGGKMMSAIRVRSKKPL